MKRRYFIAGDDGGRGRFRFGEGGFPLPQLTDGCHEACGGCCLFAH